VLHPGEPSEHPEIQVVQRGPMHLQEHMGRLTEAWLGNIVDGEMFDPAICVEDQGLHME